MPLPGSRRIRVASFLAGVLAFVLYMLGSGRSFEYDSSITVGLFVSDSSPLTPFTEQQVFNNHPLFSFLEWLVWHAGGDTEAWMRVLPALCAALTVGFVTSFAASRWGQLAGGASALIVGTNPLFVEQARSVRGYTLMTLAVVVATMLLPALRSNWRSWQAAVYVIALAAAMATHLYGAMALVVHIAYVVSQNRDQTRRFARYWAGALVVGGLAYVGLADDMAGSASGRGRAFVADFPVELGRALLGQDRLSVGLLAAVVAAAGLLAGTRRHFGPVIAGVASLATVWLIAPSDLYPRFFVWLVPGVASATAVAVARQPWLAAVVAVAVGASVADAYDTWAAEPPQRETAAIVDEARARGDAVCAIGAESLVAYTDPPTEVVTVEQLPSCDLVVVLGSWGDDFLRNADKVVDLR